MKRFFVARGYLEDSPKTTYCKLVFYLFLFTSPVFLKAQQLLPIKKDKKWGLIDQKGNIKLQPRYDAISIFDEFGYANIQQNEQVGLINQIGKEILAPQYDDIRVISKTYFALLKNNHWQLINSNKKVLLENFQDAMIWEDYGIAFSRNDQWGLIDFNGKLLIDAKYEALQPQGKFLITQNGSHFGLHLKNGQQILPPRASELHAVNSNTYLFKKDGLWGAYNDGGTLLFPAEYEAFAIIDENAIQIKTGANHYLYLIDNEQIVKGYFYEKFLPFSTDYYLVQQKGKFGLIDNIGQTVLTARFDEIQPFTEEYFRVRNEGFWGIIDKKGKEVIPIYFDYIAPLNELTSLVLKDNQYGIIDQFAQFAIPIEYDQIVLEEEQIKAYKGNTLSLFSIAEDGHINKTENSFNEHLTFKISGAKKSKKGISNDNAYHLDKFEWFYSRNHARWGLRTSADGSIAIDPQFDHIEPKTEYGFTLVGLKKRTRLTFRQTSYMLEMAYGLVSNEIGKLITPIDFLHIEFSDFEQGLPLARCIFVNGKHGLINRIGQIVEKDAAYIDEFKNGVARIGIYGRLTGNTKTEGLEPLSDYLDRLQTPYYMIDYTKDDQHFRDYAALTCQDCVWGYIDTLGKTIIRTQYEAAKSYIKGVALMQQDGKWGAVNQENKVVVPFKYDEINFLEKEGDFFIKVHTKAYRFGLIDTLGHIAVDALYQDIGRLKEDRLAVKQNELWGFTDKEGNMIVPCKFQQVGTFHEGIAAAKKDGQWGFIDKMGKNILPFQYGKVGNFQEGLAWVTTAKGLVYINKSGETIIEGEFDKVFDFEWGIARVVVDRKFGLINQEGKYILKPKFIDISKFDDNGLAVVRYGGERVRSGIINLQGTLITDNHYHEIRAFSEDRAAVKLKNQYGYIDTKGDLVIPAIYSRISPFAEGRAAVQKNGNCGYINKNGDVIVALAYSKCLEFNSGRAVVYKGYQKAGLLNDTGEAIISPSLNRLINFKNGRGLMRDNNYRFYFITEDADIFDGYYQEALNFQHGVAVVRSNNKWGIVNQKGIKIIPPKYDRIESFKDAYAKVRIKGFYGLINLQGEILVPTNFESIQHITHDIFKAEQGGRIGYFDNEGKWIWQMQE